MINLRCYLFGHKPPVYSERGWWSPGNEYGKIVIGPKDGVGRVHGKVHGKCARCDENFIMARVHIPDINVDPKDRERSYEIIDKEVIKRYGTKTKIDEYEDIGIG